MSGKSKALVSVAAVLTFAAATGVGFVITDTRGQLRELRAQVTAVRDAPGSPEPGVTKDELDAVRKDFDLLRAGFGDVLKAETKTDGRVARLERARTDIDRISGQVEGLMRDAAGTPRLSGAYVVGGFSGCPSGTSYGRSVTVLSPDPIGSPGSLTRSDLTLCEIR